MSDGQQLNIDAIGTELHVRFKENATSTGKRANLHFSADEDELRVEGATAAINQDLRSSASPTFVDLISTGSQYLGTIQHKTKIVTVPTTSVKALASGYELVAAPGANKFLQFLGGIIALDYNATAYATPSAVGSLVIRTNTSNTVQSLTVTPAGLMTASADAAKTLKPLATDVVLNVGRSLELFNTGANYTLGDSPLKVIIHYRVLDLS